MKRKLHLEESALTEEDLALSFSRDIDIIEKLHLKLREKPENDEETVKISSKKNIHSGTSESRSEASSFMNSSAFESYE